MEDNKRKLYDALSEDYDLGSFEQFSADIADDTKRRKLYDAAIEDYDFGDYDSFSAQLGFGNGASSQSAPVQESVSDENVTPQFEDEPNLDALNERARKSAEKEQRRSEKEAEKVARDAQKAEERAKKEADKAARDANEARRKMTPQERTKAFNARFVEREKAYAEAHPEEVAAENEAKRRENAEIRAEKERASEDVQRFGTGNARYSFEEAVSAGEQFAEIAPEIAGIDKRLSDFNARYGDLEQKIADYNAGKIQLTPDEFKQMQSEYGQYKKESEGLSLLVKKYDEVLNTEPGREYKETSERLTELANGPKTPESIAEYGNEYARLQRNPIYRASLGENAPSEDEIQACALQNNIAYYEEKMKTAKGDEKKMLKQLFSNAKEALYANPWYKKQTEAKIAENQAENERIGLLRSERAAQVREDLIERNFTSKGKTPTAYDQSFFWQYEKGDPELQRLDAAAHMHDDAIREYRKPTKYDESKGLRNVGKGLGNWASDTNTWSFGIEGFAEDIAVVRPVLEKVQSIVGNLNENEVVTEGNIKALEEQLTPGELAVLDAYFEKVGAVSAKGADTSIGYQIGQGIGDMVTLGIEMIATGGAGGVARTATDKGLKKGLVKLLGKRAYRKAAQSGAGKVALWAASKIPADMVETAVRIPFMPSTYKALGEGSVQLDSDYKVRPLSEYAPEKMWDQYVEQLTEVSNGFAFPLIGKVVKTPGMQKMIKGVLGENGARALRTFMERGDIKLLDDAMLGSFGGEWEEELLGAVIHSVTDDPNAMRDFFSAEQQLVLLGTLAPLPISRGLAGGVPMAYTTAKTDIAWNRAQRELERAGIDEGRISRLKEVLDNAPVTEAAREVMNTWHDATEGLMEQVGDDATVRGTFGQSGIRYGENARLYDRLAHYFWAAQQKRALGLMDEIEQDRKIEAKRSELEQRYGGVFYHQDIVGGSSIDVIDHATMNGADGNPVDILITSEKPNFNNEYAYVSEDGGRGFVNGMDVTFRGVVPLDEHLARLVMEDAQNEQVQGMVNEAVQGNRSLRDIVEALPEITYNGQKGSLIRATEDGAVFVPEDGEADNIPLTWAELAEANGIEVPDVPTEAERVEAATADVAARYQAQQDIADNFNDVLNSTFNEAVVDTDEGPANVIDIISDTIDPDAGTAQFTVQLPDGRRSVTMAIPIEPVLAQLRGDTEAWEGGEAPAPAAEPVPEETPAEAPAEEPAEETPKIPLDKDGNPIYDAPGVSVEDALADMYTTEGLDEADVDDYIINRAAEAEKGRAVKQGKMSLKEWGAKKKEANRIADFWGELAKFAEENKSARENEQKEEAARQELIKKYGVDTSKFDLTPQTAEEAVADYIATDKLINLDDAIRETLGRRKDNRVPTELFRHLGVHGILTKKGGLSVADVARDIVGEYGDTVAIEEDEARDLIINMLVGKTKSEIRDTIFNNRLEQARKEQDMFQEEEPAPTPKPAPKPAPEPQPAPAPKPEAPQGGEEKPAAPETPAGQEEKGGEKGEEIPGNAGNNGGNSVPLGEGKPEVPAKPEGPATPATPATPEVPGSLAEIKDVNGARAFYEAKFGKGKKADKLTGLWEKTHPNAGTAKASAGETDSMARALPEGLSEEAAHEIEVEGVSLAVDLLEDDGLVKYKDFFKFLVENLGDNIRQFVASVYLGAKARVDKDVRKQMDTEDTVYDFDENIDLNDIDNEQDDTDIQPGDSAGADTVDGGAEGEGGENVPGAGDDGRPTEGDDGAGEDEGGGAVAEGPAGEPGEGTGEQGSPADAGEDNGGSPSDGGRGTKRGSGQNRGRKRGSGKSEPGVGRDTGGEGTPGVKEVTEAEKEAAAAREEQKAYDEEKERIKDETDTNKLKSLMESIKEKLTGITDKFDLARAKLAGQLRAIQEKLRDLFKSNIKKAEALAQEKVPYESVSDPAGTHTIGSVVPSAAADALREAIKRVEKEVGKPIANFVQEELGYESLDDMFTGEGKDIGLSGEQVDAVGLAIYQIKTGKMLIVGDMTGVGKGRVGAALIRWGKKHGKKVLFVTEQPNLFTTMYEDINDIGGLYRAKGDKSPTDAVPWIVNDDAEANITEVDDNDVKTVLVPHPNDAEMDKLYDSDTDELPVAESGRNKAKIKGRKYDFVMMTYSQGQAGTEEEEGDSQKVKKKNLRNTKARRKLKWIQNYAKDAVVIMDESHKASGQSARGGYFQSIAEVAQGVCFMSATFAKTPSNMVLYAIRSSMGEAMMTKEQLIAAINDYGLPMQEILASALFKTGEMVRRERDFEGVKINWPQPEEIYTEEEIETCRDLSDKTTSVINSIIDFQRRFVNAVIKKMNEPLKEQNEKALLSGQKDIYVSEYASVPYSGQVSNVVGMMLFAIKAKKAADMAIEQIKRGEKPVIAVDNTLGAYIDSIEGDIESADFGMVLRKGLATALKYQLTRKHLRWDDKEGKYKEVKGDRNTEKYDSIAGLLGENGIAEMENLENLITDYGKETLGLDLSLSPIDYIKNRIRKAGYKIGEITKRKNELVQNPDGTWAKRAIKHDKKGVIRKFNGGKAKNPIPEAERLDAIIMNRSGATGNSLHASRRFGDQKPRKMIILQPAKDSSEEVQIRGRIDRTGQVQRGEYFYIMSPIPAEKKIIMMLRQKLASLDANSVGSEKVESNRVEAEDMDNKYGDEVAKDFLVDHPEINEQLDANKRVKQKVKKDGTTEWTGHPGLLYDLLIGMQRMTCAEQELVLSELEESYAQKIEYLNQNGINDLTTTTMDLEAETKDTAIMIKGRDNNSISEFAHDTTIERVEVNVLRKQLHTSDVHKKMRELGAEKSDGTPVDYYDYGESFQQKAREAVASLIAAKEEKQREAEESLLADLRVQSPQMENETDEQYEKRLKEFAEYTDLVAKNEKDLNNYRTTFENQLITLRRATRALKAGWAYLVPLNDSENADNRFGRFLGFKAGKDGRPKSVEAVFATKDSRAMVSIPIITMDKVMKRIIDNSGGFLDAFGKSSGEYASDEERVKFYDTRWDKMVSSTSARQLRYMITGNILQACSVLGSHRGTITTFTRRDAETGEITIDRGMLLAEDFDPENFVIRERITKDEVWDSSTEFQDELHGITAHREGDKVVIKFRKLDRKDKLKDHKILKDEEFKQYCDGGSVISYSTEELRAVISEGNVEAALNHLYENYGFTQGHLLVMPDSADKVDRIVFSGKSAQDTIAELQPKHRGVNSGNIDEKVEAAVKDYKMDVGNEELKTRIRELVQLRQAWLRESYTKEGDAELAWDVIMYQQEADDRAKDKPGETPDQAIERKQMRQKYQNVAEACKEELAFRGFAKGHLKHFKQGKVDFSEMEKTFKEFNTDKQNGELAKKVFAIVKKLNLDVFMNEKLRDSEGGNTGGRVMNFNWHFMNEEFIPDQLKANTILHESIHTVTAYAFRLIDYGNEHLMPQELTDIANELKSIYDIVSVNPNTFHQTGKYEWQGYREYGCKNVKEMLSEAGSNPGFRNALSKIKMGVSVKFGVVSLIDVTNSPNYTGRTENALEGVYSRLEQMIDQFNEHAYVEAFRGTSVGDRDYSERELNRTSESLNNPIDRAAAIVKIGEVAKKLGVKFKEDPNLKAKGVFSPKTGEIRINIDAHSDTADLEATLLHEAVAHYGLRNLFKEDWPAVRKKFYEQATDGIKAKVDALAKQHGLSKEVAMEEYIASLAEDGRFDEEEETFWQRVVTAIKRMLQKIGFNAGRLTDDDFRALLYASFVNMRDGGPIESAAKIATYQALRKMASASHDFNPDDNGPDGGGNTPTPTGSYDRDSESTIEKREIRDRSIADGSFMKAPNGQPTNLTEDRWLTVRTKAFKDWFGDWENDPANASKVVDENGEPLVVYRVGQTKGYSVFDENRGGNWRGFYFTNRDAALKNYATANTTESQVRAFFVKSVNPFTENNFNVLQGDKSELVDMGHDGMIYAPEGIDARNFEVKVFNSNQIKSATDNNGNFSTEDPDIYHRPIYSSYVPTVPTVEQDEYDNELRDLRSQELDILRARGRDSREYKELKRKEGDVIRRYLEAIDPGHVPLNFVSVEGNDLEEFFVQHGDSRPQAEEDARFVRRVRAYGFYDDAREDISFFIEHVPSMEYARRSYVHERQHHLNNTGSLAYELASSAKGDLDALETTLAKLTNERVAHTYRAKYGERPEFIADEILAHAMTRVFDSPTFANELKNLHLADEIYDFITRLADEQFNQEVRPAVQSRAYGSFADSGRNQSGESNDGREPGEVSGRSGGSSSGRFGIQEGSLSDLPEDIRKDVEDLETDQETEVLYRRASNSATAQTAAEMYGNKVRTIGGAVKEVLVDEMAPVDALMDALATESGTKIKDDERVSDMMRETGGKAMQAVRDYDKKFLQPMWSAVGEFRKKTGESIKDTETYIGLKSGLERNVVLAKRDAKRDYQAEYDAEIDEINQEEKTKKKALDKQLENGKISDVTYSGELTLLQQEMQKKRDDAELRLKGQFADVDAGTDKRFLEYRKKDYSAITAWAETEDIQEAERLAGDYVADMESRAGAGTTKELWKRINAATKETLKFQYEHQILSRQQYQDISKMMEYYVPMRGFSEDTAEDLFNYYVTPQSNDFQATVLTAKGRKTWYEGPLGNIGAMHSSAISQGVKNEAKLALLDAVRRRPKNTIATVTRAWFVKNGQKDANGKDQYDVAYPQIPQGATLAEREAIIAQFEEDMAEAKRNGDAYNSHREVDLHGGVVAFERQAHKNEHIVQVREGGKEYGILINGNPAAAQAINGVRRSNGAGEKFLGYMRSFTRVLSSMFTTFSVPFWVSNFQRDHGQGLTNAFIRNNPGYVGRYIANRIRAAKLFPLILGSETMDKALAKGDPVANLYKQYLDNGGPMGQNRIEDNEYFERQMKRYLDNSAKQGIIKGATAVLNVIGGVGEAIETITRFAVFMTSMESGRPIHESISDAKEISTNFARKGSGRSFSRDELDRMTHADGTKLKPIERGFVSALSVGVEICRATIPFFNAAVQGLENKVTNYREHWGKTLLADSVYLMLGFGMKMLLGGAGGDDDKEKYSHTSDYLRRNNILNPLGNGVYAKWALPQEYRVMYALGDVLASAFQRERPAEDLGMDVFGAIMQLSPIGAVTDEVAFSAENKKKAYETLITNASPGIVAPVLESIFNMDFKGARIYNEGFNENLHAYPGWTKALPTTGSEYVAVAKWLNEATGGNDVERGWVNINPAIVEHLVESYFSGPYQIVVRVPEAVAKIAKGEATVRDVPLLNRIILNTNDNQRDAYYSNMYYYFKEKNTEAERIHSEYKGRPKEGKVAEFYQSDNYKYMLIFNKYDKVERELRKASKQMAEKGDLKKQKEYDERLQNIQYQIAKECLDLYFGRNGKEEVK